MDGFIWADRRSDGCDLLWRGTFSSSRVCAGRSFGKDNAIMGSIPERMGIPGRSDPTGRGNWIGPEQKIPDSRSIDWRVNDLPHPIPVFGHFVPRSRRAGDQRRLNYFADTLLYAGAALVLASALPRDPERVEKTVD